MEFYATVYFSSTIVRTSLVKRKFFFQDETFPDNFRLPRPIQAEDYDPNLTQVR